MRIEVNSTIVVKIPAKLLLNSIIGLIPLGSLDYRSVSEPYALPCLATIEQPETLCAELISARSYQFECRTNIVQRLTINRF